MNTDLHQCPISVSSSLEAAIEKIKAEHYENVGYNDMFKDLITRGLIEAERKALSSAETSDDF